MHTAMAFVFMYVCMSHMFRKVPAIALQVLAEEITPTLKKLKEVTPLHWYPNHVVF